MKQIQQEKLTGERALFQSQNIQVHDSVFFDGESPLKESKNIEIFHSHFKWKYPLWYCQYVYMKDSVLLETARSGIWYTQHIKIENSVIEAPKTFRKSTNIVLDTVNLPIAEETLWNCEKITLYNVTARGDYFGFHSRDIKAENITITGNYVFDSAKNIEIYNATLVSKDAFWNCENVTVYHSTIIGEYIGWNSKNITFVNCTIESEQGFCYIENLKIVDCKLINTTLAFEYSTVDVVSSSSIDSVINPTSGNITAPTIGEVIQNDSAIDTNHVTICTSL